MRTNTPVTQEFIMGLIGWAALLAVVGLLAYGISRQMGAEGQRMDKEEQFYAKPTGG
jgi:hypothetical protein